MNDLTTILRQQGNSEELLVAVYDELRKVATARMAQESAGQTLQATALVHEAWIQLVEEGDRTWENRAHFFGAAAHAMRRILIDASRRKSRLKRGADQERVNLDDLEIAGAAQDDNLLLIHEALEKLEREDPEQGQIVVMKFFGGMTNEEVAANLDISERTVYRQWVCAKARLVVLIRQLDGTEGP